MNKYLLFLPFFFALTVAHGQTNVSGGIYTNTTWTLANSPYIVVDTVVVFPTVTLTIQPGVVVKFANNTRLEIRQATIVAAGTTTDSITFTSNSTLPTMGSWDCIYLNGTPADTLKFSYCNFLYATKGITTNYGLMNTNWVWINFCRFSYNQTGILAGTGNTYMVKNTMITFNQTGITYVNAAYCPGMYIYNCWIESNTTAGISLHAGKNSVKDCAIKYNGIGLHDDGVIGRKYIHNLIKNNSVGIKAGEYMNAGDSIICNSICSNTTYNLNYIDNTGGSLDVSKNYWCSEDSSAIAATIYDGYDNINLGLVNFMPLDTLQCHPSALGIPNYGSPALSFSIFPNPFSIQTTILSDKYFKDATMIIYNSNGQTVQQINNLAGQTIILHRDNLPSGLYFVRLTQDGKNFSADKFIITDK